MLASIILSLALTLLLSCHIGPTKGQKCMKMNLPMCALAVNGFPYNTTVTTLMYSSTSTVAYFLFKNVRTRLTSFILTIFLRTLTSL